MARFLSRTTIWKKLTSLRSISSALQANSSSNIKIKHLEKDVPTPSMLADVEVPLAGTRVLLLSNAENGMTKRLSLLLQNRDVEVKVATVQTEDQMVRASDEYAPDLILCPYLTKRVPEVLWQNKDTPCLIVHPGVAGDRGMHSLEWVINDDVPEWGVTVLEAAAEMDAGDIWSTQNFQVFDRNTTKNVLYNTDVADAAAIAALDAMKRFKLKIPPTPLDYSLPGVIGTFRRKMTGQDRLVDWNTSAGEILRKIRMSDTQPGARASLCRETLQNVRLFGGHLQPNDTKEAARYLGRHDVIPGTPTAQKDGAVLIPTNDGHGIWITHMKAGPGKSHLKLPAMDVLRPVMGELPYYTGKSSWEEVRVSRSTDGRIAVVHFDYYNGAMSTDQCRRLERALSAVGQDKTVEVVVLLGGKQFFSTGIHLNTIDVAPNSAAESWENINAINDVIKAFFSLQDKVTVSALQSGAGAGGVMMAASADLVWAREGIVLTPSYKAMNLYGSEYWTYFLPERVGHQRALELTEGGESLLSEQAHNIGLVDSVFGSCAREFLEILPARLDMLLGSSSMQEILRRKSKRGREWHSLLEEHRQTELSKMSKCFQSVDYNEARKHFVRH